MPQHSPTPTSYETHLFDLDGTLCDPGFGIAQSVEYAVSRLGLPALPPETLHRFVGPPLHSSFMKYCGLEARKTEVAITYFRKYFKEDGVKAYAAYPGISELLRRLRNRDKAPVVVTSKPRPFALQILEITHLISYFDLVVGPELDERVSKDITLRKALNQLHDIDRSRAVMIGDKAEDVLAAKANDVDSIGVLYGYGSEEEIRKDGATVIVKSVTELSKLLTAFS